MGRYGVWLGSLMLALLAGCSQEPAAGAGSAGSVATAPQSGESIYQKFCISCHAAGIAGAPRTGDAEAWAIRAAKGREALLASTINGIAPGMPARGLCSRCSDEELAKALDYMLAQSQ